MRGRLPPDTEKPLPEIVSALITNAAVPLEVTVTCCETEVPTATLPNSNELALSFIAGAAAVSWMTKVFEDPLTLALTVAVCDVVTNATVAVNEAVDAPEATETEAGTETALLLLPTLTPTPEDGAGALNATVHDVVPAPVNELVAHENELMPSAIVEVVAGTSAIEMDFNWLPSVAVMLAVWFVLTASTLAVNVALVDPAATMTEAGTLTEAVLLDRLTTSPPAGAAVSVVTVQLSVPDPTICALVQLNPLNVATGTAL